MQIKSYTSGLINGIDKAFESLDRQVAEDLGKDRKIHSSEDSYYTSKDSEERLVRVIVYS